MADRKRCSQCGQHKPLECFSPCRTTLQSACKTCRNKAAASANKPVTVQEKQCHACKETKPSEQFWLNRRSSDGLQKECKACTTARKSATRYAVTLTEKKCKHCGKTKLAHEFPKDARRKGGLRSECRACSSVKNRAGIYKIPITAAQALCSSRCCEICGFAFVSQSDVNIDHCHATGRVRGALCWDCNKMIGCAKENADTLLRAVLYLGKARNVEAERA